MVTTAREENAAYHGRRPRLVRAAAGASRRERSAIPGHGRARRMRSCCEAAAELLGWQRNVRLLRQTEHE